MGLRTIVSLAVGCLAAAVQATAVAGDTYCCSDASGRRVCADRLPRECVGREYRIINERGITVKRVEAPLSPEERAQREAEEAQRKEAERARLEQRRRDRALLDAYSSEQDIDRLRDRALKDVDGSIRRERERHEIALKQKKKLDEEMEFYRKTPPPQALVDAIKDNESVLRAHLSVIEAKERERDAIKAKYEEEKRRYREIVGSGGNERRLAPGGQVK